MTHGSLFSGIGGFDLAAEWSGWENLFNCEWEEFPRKVLKHHFPNAKQYEDIKDFDATDYNGRIDVLSGGFPCQPFSVAGQRKGTEDSRHLWPEMLRVIGECQPRWVVGENVRGLVSWSDGLVLETCYSDLENLGYSVQSFIIPACAAGNAPHRRDRVWIVAHNHNGDGQKERLQAGRKVDVHGIEGNGNASDTKGGRVCGDSGELCEAQRRQNNQLDAESVKHGPTRSTNAPDTDSTSRKGERINRQGKGESFRRGSKSIQNRWENFPTVPPICGGDDGLPKELDGITFSKWRRESIKAYGNAIVPQVAHRIFQSINDYENDTD
jgi:DNA (cytosine-5)-methyltransferase 1